MRRFNYTELCYFWLSIKFGRRQWAFRKLLDEYSADYIADNIDEMHRLHPELLREQDVIKLRAESAEAYADRLAPKIDRSGIRIILAIDPEFPNSVLEVKGLPSVLFALGKPLPQNSLNIGIVGTRNATEYGKHITENIAGGLAVSGVCIISGMAAGIDSCAAEAALCNSRSECKTVAVLGCGVDVPYPSSNRALYERIIEAGTVISQYEPQARADRYTFPERNKIIAALSKGVLVTEGGAHSGSLITAKCAAEYGRQVFCVPGRIGDEMSEGSNSLLASGAARMAMSAADILGFYGMAQENVNPLSPANANAAHAPHGIARKSPEFSDPNERLVYDSLSESSKTFDELCDITKLPVSSLNLILTSLEFSRIIKQSQGRLYSRENK